MSACLGCGELKKFGLVNKRMIAEKEEVGVYRRKLSIYVCICSSPFALEILVFQRTHIRYIEAFHYGSLKFFFIE